MESRAAGTAGRTGREDLEALKVKIRNLEDFQTIFVRFIRETATGTSANIAAVMARWELDGDEVEQ